MTSSKERGERALREAVCASPLDAHNSRRETLTARSTVAPRRASHVGATTPPHFHNAQLHPHDTARSLGHPACRHVTVLSPQRQTVSPRRQTVPPQRGRVSPGAPHVARVPTTPRRRHNISPCHHDAPASPRRPRCRGDVVSPRHRRVARTPCRQDANGRRATWRRQTLGRIATTPRCRHDTVGVARREPALRDGASPSCVDRPGRCARAACRCRCTTEY